MIYDNLYGDEIEYRKQLDRRYYNILGWSCMRGHTSQRTPVGCPDCKKITESNPTGFLTTIPKAVIDPILLWPWAFSEE